MILYYNVAVILPDFGPDLFGGSCQHVLVQILECLMGSIGHVILCHCHLHGSDSLAQIQFPFFLGGGKKR